MAAVIIALTAQAPFAQFRETRQLTSNNVIALAGSGDTLWLATERGFNYQAPVDSAGVWHGFEDNGLGGRIGGLEFGGGVAAAILYNSNGEPGFWQFNHNTGKRQEIYFKFSGGVSAENDAYLATGSTVYAYGFFWAAFNYGGLIKYNPVTNTVLAIRPVDNKDVPPRELDSLTIPLSGGDSARVVTEIGVIQGADGSDSLIWAATLDPLTVWMYNPVNTAWHKIAGKPARPIYEAIDSTARSNGFRPYLAKAGNNPDPEINDWLFLRGTDNADAGTLVIGTTTGLYICRSAEPLSGTYGAFTLFSYVREVKAGEAYALPGIIRGGMDGRYEKCVFVYKLKKDGDVTIKVYDYNMSLVKTVVKGARRSSKAERSTAPAGDVWDGTNQGGKRAWPGVYYFKITSTGGDRFFGKIILAK